MSDSEEAKDGIKIVDKRRFEKSGEAKDADSAAEKVSEENSTKIGDSSVQPEIKEEPGYQAVDFPSFIVSLATQTMMLLGEIPGEEQGIEINLTAARQTIDVIAMLEEKTKGNLSDTEQKLVTDVLTSLRMAYVKKSK